jgi:hypothetical protein
MFIFPFSIAQKVLLEIIKENPYGANFVYLFLFFEVHNPAYKFDISMGCDTKGRLF